MTQGNSGQTAPEPLLGAWIKWTMDFWEAMAHMGPGPAGPGGRSGRLAPAAELPGGGSGQAD